MITNMEILNFRGISKANINLKKTTIIMGPNDSCKTTTLAALNWAISGITPNFDMPGKDENNNLNVYPRGIQKGESTKVSITVNGKVYSREQIPQFNDDGKIIKNPQTLRVDGVKYDTLKTWQAELYADLHFKPYFMGIDETRLFMNPMYALGQMDPKDLRMVLVGLGCNVKNDEIYELGFTDLKQYETTYSGDFTKMRKALKVALKENDTDVKYYEKNIQALNGVNDVFDSAKLDELNQQKATLLLEKENAKAGGVDDEISRLEEKIKSLEAVRENEIRSAKTEIMNKISVEKTQLEIDKSSRLAKRQLLCRKLDTEKESLAKNYELKKKEATAYTNSCNNLLDEFAKSTERIKTLTEDNSNKAILMKALDNQEFTGNVTCPHCGCVFPADVNAKEQWEKHKESQKADYTKSIEKNEQEISKLRTRKLEIKGLGKSARVQEQEALSQAEAINKELNEVNEKIANLEKMVPDETEAIKIKANIESLEKQLNGEFKTSVDQEIENTKGTLYQLKSHDNMAVEIEKNEIDEKIATVDAAIDEQLTIRTDVRNKRLAKENYNLAIQKRNNTESLLIRVNEFIHKLIEMINQRALEKTGIRFIMLEENLTNDGVTEVCYAVDVDGVPFQQINSSRKVTMGTFFISRIKDILTEHGVERNNLPVIADGLEKIDKLEKIDAITCDQLVCTRVDINNSVQSI